MRAGEERNKDVDLPDVSPILPSAVHWHLNMMSYQCSVNMTLGAAEQNKGKQREELADRETLPPDNASPTAEFDTIENRTFWKFLRARGKNATTSPAQMTALGNHPTSTELSYRRRHATSPEVVEVHAARGFQVTFNFLFLILAFLLQLETTETCRKEAGTQDKEQAPCTTRKRLVDGGYIIASGVCSYTTCNRLVPGRCIFAGWSCAGSYIITACWGFSVAYC